jgi:hypothetical protein
MEAAVTGPGIVSILSARCLAAAVEHFAFDVFTNGACVRLKHVLD